MSPRVPLPVFFYRCSGWPQKNAKNSLEQPCGHGVDRIYLGEQKKPGIITPGLMGLHLRDQRTNDGLPDHGSNIGPDIYLCHHDRNVVYRAPHDKDFFIITVSVNGCKEKPLGLRAKLGQGEPLVPGNLALDESYQ